MTIELQKPLKASMTKNGKVHRVEHLSGDHHIVLCRGFAPIHKSKLHFTDSKPDCKACLNIKNR